MHRARHYTNGKHHHHLDLNHNLQKNLQKIKSALHDATSDAKERASDLISESYDNMKTNTANMRDGVSDYIADRPFKSLGIALLSGIVVGFLLRKK